MPRAPAPVAEIAAAGATRAARRERCWDRPISPARDVTVFTDETCTISGPVRPGPSLIEWAEGVRSGAIGDVLIDDAGTAAELRGLRGESFPTRRLQSHYLDWFWRRTVASAPAGVRVEWVQDAVASVHEGDDTGGGWLVELAGPSASAAGSILPADIVVYAVGHNGREPDGETLRLIEAAASAGLHYVPPDFTADADLSGLGAGEDVIVRGMGLAAVDAVVLLAEGRGGRFEPDDAGALQYRPSGREPRLHLGSRRGVPYRSKVGSAIQGAPPVLHVLTKEAIARLLARPGTVDFADDVWPLVREELVWGHYRELFTGHPERVRASWDEFQEVLRATAGDVEALRAAAAAVIPDCLDRFDVPTLDRPLAGEQFPDAETLQGRVRAHIQEDLALRTTQERSPAQAVFLALLLSFLALGDIPTDRWSARSRAVTLPIQWHTFFSYVASGPPAHRLEELLALSRAGVVRFLGPDVHVRIEPGRGFVASSPRVPGEQVAATLVDAWLPRASAAISDNPALRELALVHGRELQVADADFAGTLGRIDVDDTGHVRAPGGPAHSDVFAIGSFTSATEAGAFTRPGSDSLSLRQTDVVAGAVVDAIAASGAARAPLVSSTEGSQLVAIAER